MNQNLVKHFSMNHLPFSPQVNSLEHLLHLQFHPQELALPSWNLPQYHFRRPALELSLICHCASHSQRRLTATADDDDALAIINSFLCKVLPYFQHDCRI